MNMVDTLVLAALVVFCYMTFLFVLALALKKRYR